jgi:undecaprenyl-diphosphatase
MEDILHAIVLGVVQGLTEFLPISSSGHLIIARELFGWEFTDDLTFDVALHLGTTVAVIGYFWREWLTMLRSGWEWLLDRNRSTVDADGAYNARLLALLALGSVPAAVSGVFFDVVLDVRSPIVVGVMFIVFAVVLFIVDRVSHGQRDLAQANGRDAVWIGTAQAVSLVPGVSRSGITICAGMLRDFSRVQAARFSFLLATPAILGAGFLKGAEAAADGIPADDIDAIVVGATVSAIVGWLSIRFLLRLLQIGTLTPFVLYRLMAGAFIIVYFSA